MPGLLEQSGGGGVTATSGGSVIRLPAGEDLSSSQSYFVKIYDGQVYIADNDPDPLIFGVLVNAPLAGDIAVVQIAGIASLKCGESAISLGNWITHSVTTNGLGIVPTGAGPVHARALADGAAGDVIPVLIRPSYVP